MKIAVAFCRPIERYSVEEESGERVQLAIAVRTALPVRRWPRIFTVDVAIDAGLGDDARLQQETTPGMIIQTHELR